MVADKALQEPMLYHARITVVTADLMAEYAMNEKIILKVNVSNLANKLYADALYTGHYIPGAGRVAQVTINLKF